MGMFLKPLLVEPLSYIVYIYIFTYTYLINSTLPTKTCMLFTDKLYSRIANKNHTSTILLHFKALFQILILKSNHKKRQLQGY